MLINDILLHIATLILRTNTSQEIEEIDRSVELGWTGRCNRCNIAPRGPGSWCTGEPKPRQVPQSQREGSSHHDKIGSVSTCSCNRLQQWFLDGQGGILQDRVSVGGHP